MVKENLDKYKHVNLAIKIKDLDHWRQIQPFTNLRYNDPLYKKEGFIIYFNIDKTFAKNQYSNLDYEATDIEYTYISSNEICINNTIHELW